MQSAPLLLVEALARRFGKHEVVRSLNVRLEPGERVALRGPNGSGKTTVLRCIGGTITPSAGRIAIGGRQAGTLAARRLTGVSLSNERSFYLRLTGHANLLFFARLRLGSERDAVREVRALEEELELEEIAAQRVDKCSTGMVQQLAFARALLNDPPLLLLDEPTRSLDEAAVGRLWAALDHRPRTALVIATHRDEDTARCGARIDLPS
jgi:ABC-2 type transport system ATP-binding protein